MAPVRQPATVKLSTLRMPEGSIFFPAIKKPVVSSTRLNPAPHSSPETIRFSPPEPTAPASIAHRKLIAELT